MPVKLKWLRVLVSVACAGLALSGLALSIGAVAAGPQPKWPLFGFEIVLLVASVIGVLLAQGKLRGAPGLALLCVAGTIFIACVLGYFGANGRLDLRGDRAPILLKPLLAARLGLVAGLACASMFVVLRRDRVAVGTFAKGLLWAAPLIVGGLLAWKMRTTLGGLPGPAQAALVFFGGVALIACLSGAGHLFIRAFEIGSAKGDGDGAAKAA